ncbi:ABC transporter substrate-binding protein [Flavobacterium amnicola]|uniref:ABC transporter substrate-binding protein n=1 Tax=Flavobacterium amnicola TaxID=2506422 RepID=A0A4Q1K269_9FLAO|nr:ABC transporter substrate-binding protein [Flavobacterium amnicola]RXR17708.1 ABC transporter substrate-binding protein [Flavobacterium amnicola]
MNTFLNRFICSLILITIWSCKKESTSTTTSDQKVENSIQHAKDLEIYKHKGYSIIKVKNPWPNANKVFTYILQEKNGIIPDSLKEHTTIQVPIKSVVATSTTHISSLVMLEVENTLIGFPHLDYISSEKVRKNIDSGKVKELGNNQTLNVEVAIDLAPSVIIGYGLDNHNPSLDNLEKSGLKVILNGDWNEQSPLGKAEWIKFFGALYGKEKEANVLFKSIKDEYENALTIAKKAKSHPTVLAGAMFEEIWYVPQGQSWGSLFLKDAGASYLWANEIGTGGLSLSFEKVFEKAQNADFWIGPGQFNSLEEMVKTNPHYAQFKAFKTKQVYSYSLKKGKTGGLIYFEESPNRPDLVLKDLIKILHPELLTDYELHFFQKLN